MWKEALAKTGHACINNFMSERSKVDIVLDSAMAIDNALANSNAKPENLFRTLHANAGHIKQTLKKDEFKAAANADQLALLNKAVADAEAKMATLPKPYKKND